MESGIREQFEIKNQCVSINKTGENMEDFQEQDDSGYLADKAKRDIRENQLAHLRLVKELLDRLNEATDLLQQASTANFNSNLGARIKMFLEKQNS